jgi:DNA-binding NarL/FixJ family response regulator
MKVTMTVVVADDSMIVREGLARLLTDAGCEVPATATQAPELMRVVAEHRPDAVVVDIRMPPTHTDEGLVAAASLRREYPDLGVLVLSQHLESHYATTLLAEAPEHLGYLLKDRVSDVAVLLDALHRVVEGECVVDPTIVTRLLRRPRSAGPLDGLTARERDVLGLMAEGRSNGAIAERLGLGAKTVESHVRAILQKLDLHEAPDDHRRVLAVLRFLQATDLQ